MYCKYCGKELSEGASFCTGCGKPVGEQHPKNEPEESEKKKHPQKKRTSKKSARIIAAAAVLALAVAGVGIGYKIYTEKKGTDRLEDSMSAESKRIEALADAEARAKGELEAKAIAEREEKQKAEEEAREKAEEDTWTDPETGLTKIKGGHTGKKVGYVNENGEEVIPPIYDMVSEPGENGLIRAEQMEALAFSGNSENIGCTFFYDEEGEKVYDYVRKFGEHQSTAAREGTEYFIVDRQGNRISENTYTYIGETDIYGNFIVIQKAGVGLVNAEGKENIRPQDVRIIPIDRQHTDRDGIYLVMSEGASQIITEQGEILVPWKEGQLENVSVEQQRYQINLGNGITEIRDFKGRVIVSQEYGSVILYPNGCMQKSESSAVYDPNGQEILPRENEKGYLQTVNCFSSEGIGAGIVYARGTDEYRSKQGMITLDGKISLPCMYDQIFYVPDKHVIVYSKEKQIGIMNLEGEILWEKAYDYAYVFTAKDKKNTENLLLVKRGENYGLVDMLTGKVMLECQYSMISKDSQIQENWFCAKDGKCGFWNQKDGKYTEIPNSENYAIDGFHMGSGGEAIDVYGYELGEFLKIRDGEKIGVIDRQGNMIIDPVYTEICYDEYEEVFFVRSENETGIYDKNGKIIVPLDVYEVLEWHSVGIVVKREGENETILDYKGNTVVSQDACAKSFLELGYIATYQDGENRLYTVNSGEFQKVKYTWIAPNEQDGIICVQNEEDKYGYINADGEEIIPCIFMNAYDFRDGLVVVMNEKGKWGTMNLQGDMLIDCDYENIDISYAPNLIKVEEYNYWGVLDLGGERIIDSDYNDISMGAMGTMLATGDYEGKRDIYDYNGTLLETYSY